MNKTVLGKCATPSNCNCHSLAIRTGVVRIPPIAARIHPVFTAPFPPRAVRMSCCRPISWAGGVRRRRLGRAATVALTSRPVWTRGTVRRDGGGNGAPRGAVADAARSSPEPVRRDKRDTRIVLHFSSQQATRAQLSDTAPRHYGVVTCAGNI